MRDIRIKKQSQSRSRRCDPDGIGICFQFQSRFGRDQNSATIESDMPFPNCSFTLCSLRAVLFRAYVFLFPEELTRVHFVVRAAFPAVLHLECKSSSPAFLLVKFAVKQRFPVRKNCFFRYIAQFPIFVRSLRFLF